jgi:hypothetical protein
MKMTFLPVTKHIEDGLTGVLLTHIHLMNRFHMPLYPFHNLHFALGFDLVVACQSKIFAPERCYFLHCDHQTSLPGY